MRGIDVLLELNGTVMQREDGYWWKVEARKVEPSREIPHGVRYSLTLHNSSNERVFGIDNAHGIKARKKHEPFDHRHRGPKDAGVKYQFCDAYRLLEDFFIGIDRTIERLGPSK